MIEKLRNALRQLRWKLTLTYTAVTVGTLLVMISVLVFLVLSTVLTPSEALTPDVWIAATNQQVVPIFRGLLATSPPDLVQIDTFLKGISELDTSISGREVFQVGPIQLMVRAMTEHPHHSDLPALRHPARRHPELEGHPSRGACRPVGHAVQRPDPFAASSAHGVRPAGRLRAGAGDDL